LATLPILSHTMCTLDTPGGLFILDAPFRNFEIDFDNDFDDDHGFFGHGGFFDFNFGYDDGWY
ncbi:MAG: hypothetical protein GXP29_00025, partial [Planctomycetes bacterium]|nr:hypothetical protein [Planctomycetota bacterium]